MKDEPPKEQAMQGQGHGHSPIGSLLENDANWRRVVEACNVNGMGNENPEVGDVLAFFLSKFESQAFQDWRGP